jgi:hypothetical protein
LGAALLEGRSSQASVRTSCRSASHSSRLARTATGRPRLVSETGSAPPATSSTRRPSWPRACSTPMTAALPVVGDGCPTRLQSSPVRLPPKTAPHLHVGKVLVRAPGNLRQQPHEPRRPHPRAMHKHQRPNHHQSPTPTFERRSNLQANSRRPAPLQPVPVSKRCLRKMRRRSEAVAPQPRPASSVTSGPVRLARTADLRAKDRRPGSGALRGRPLRNPLRAGRCASAVAVTRA